MRILKPTEAESYSEYSNSLQVQAGLRESQSVTIAGRVIGSPGPCFVIAEAGVNHNGDVTLAHKLIDAAAEAGADAIKFQTFIADNLALPGASKAEYQMRSAGSGESQLDMLRNLELPRSAYPGLVLHAHDKNLIFLSSPFDEASADFLEQLGVPAFKIASGEITNLPFLGHIARKGRPLLVSTGMCELEEVVVAMEEIRRGGNPPVVLLHCVSCYPAAPEDCNLLAMLTLKVKFGIPVGFSDHTLGTSIAVAAVALGAAVIERHITLDKKMNGPDHAVSSELCEFKTMVDSVRNIERALGDGIKRPALGEREIAAVARKSLYAARDLSPGTVLTPEDLVARRPGNGISPSRRGDFIGRTLTRLRTAGESIQEGDFV